MNNPYNGWANYPTWVLISWINDDKARQEYWLHTTRALNNAALLEQALRHELTERALDNFPDGGILLELLLYSIHTIDYNEIVLALIHDAHENLSYEKGGK